MIIVFLIFYITINEWLLMKKWSLNSYQEPEQQPQESEEPLLVQDPELAHCYPKSPSVKDPPKYFKLVKKRLVWSHTGFKI